MGKTTRIMLVTSLLVASVLLLTLYRVWLVVNRAMPPGLAEAEKIRWLDELGRIARSWGVFLHDLGVEPGAQPLKIFINTAFSLLFNPLPWQRVAYRDIKVSQDVYQGVPVSIYTPVTKTAGARCQGYPTIVYFHGGGWTWLSVGVYDGPLKHFANFSRFKIIAVEYRKSPEHPFPAPFNDCLSVSQYIVQHARELNVCKDFIVLAGDGAGANLAAAVANEMQSLVRLQVLINPALQMVNFATPSYQDFSGGFQLPGITCPDKEISNWMRYGNISPQLKPVMENNLHVSLQVFEYLSNFSDSRQTLAFPPTARQSLAHHKGSENDSVTSHLNSLLLDPRFNPTLQPDLKDVADAYIITSQYDVLRDEAVIYTKRLQENGVAVNLQHYWHGFHGFLLFAGGGWIEFEESQRALDHLVQFLHAQLLTLGQRAKAQAPLDQ